MNVVGRKGKPKVNLETANGFLHLLSPNHSAFPGQPLFHSLWRRVSLAGVAERDAGILCSVRGIRVLKRHGYGQVIANAIATAAWIRRAVCLGLKGTGPV